MCAHCWAWRGDFLRSNLPVPILVSRGSRGVAAQCHAFKLHAAVEPGCGRLMVLGLAHVSFRSAAVLALAYLRRRARWDTRGGAASAPGQAPVERAGPEMRHRAKHLNCF